MNRRQFLKGLGLLVPGAVAAPGILLADVHKPLFGNPLPQKVNLAEHGGLIRGLCTVSELGVFDNYGRLLAQKPFDRARCLIDGDTLKVSYTVYFNCEGSSLEPGDIWPGDIGHNPTMNGGTRLIAEGKD